MMPKILKTIVFTFVLTFTCLAFSDDKKKDDFWLPMEERVKIWDTVVSEQLSLSLPLPSPKPYTVSSNGLEATFEKDGSKWTIVGANAPIVNPTVYPKDWPIKGNDFEVLVIPEPITNYKILPFTDKIENAVKSDTISIIAAPDSYEPASFVIRSGDKDLKNVMIEVTDLKAEIKGKDGKKKTVIIPKENIDIRVVKCWYQAGVAINDTKHKLLTPELLLHDDNVVKVDYDRQINLLRNLNKIEDAEKLKPFDIPERQNKQIWLTAHIKETFPAAKYTGSIKISAMNHETKKLVFHIEVLPFTLPEPMLEYALYYEGRLSGSDKPVIEAGNKTEKQMEAELEDMKEHGLTNATVWHRVNEDKSKWDEDWKRLQKTLDIRKKVSWANKPLLYLDWKVSFKEDLNLYKEKIQKIIEIANNNGIKEIYIYGVDERIDKQLEELNNTLYKYVHDFGAKNFVAGWIGPFSQYSSNIDLMVVSGISINNNPNMAVKIANLKKGNKIVMSYNSPQAGVEEPETYRNNYGINLIKVGADGALNYAYQTGSCWNDFADKKWRSHTMAYPTVNKPIPTIQWEGWREGVNDVRYLSLLKSQNNFSTSWFEKQFFVSNKVFREDIIKLLNKLILK